MEEAAKGEEVLGDDKDDERDKLGGDEREGLTLQLALSWVMTLLLTVPVRSESARSGMRRHESQRSW